MAKLFETPLGVNTVDIRKKINGMLSEARKEAKPAICIMCGKPQTSFCNSHSVPQMALRSIAENGIVIHAPAALGVDERIIDIENGVNKSGTFNYICNDCDNTFFQDYENPDNIVQPPTDKILAEIAVKNMLLQLSKRAVERKLIEIRQRDYNAFDNPEVGMNVKNLDFAEFENEVIFHKNIVENNEFGGYQIVFWKLLPYTVPIAMQSAIAVTRDIEGVEINNIYDMNPNIRMQYLHLAIFPLNGKSVVLAFYHKRDKLYRRLRHQFNCMGEKEALVNINYLVFKYTENYYMARKIEEEITTNDALQRLSQENDGMPSLGMLGIDNSFGIGYTPVSKNDIPNFLAPEWAV